MAGAPIGLLEEAVEARVHRGGNCEGARHFGAKSSVSEVGPEEEGLMVAGAVHSPIVSRCWHTGFLTSRRLHLRSLQRSLSSKDKLLRW